MMANSDKNMRNLDHEKLMALYKLEGQVTFQKTLSNFNNKHSSGLGTKRLPDLDGNNINYGAKGSPYQFIQKSNITVSDRDENLAQVINY